MESREETVRLIAQEEAEETSALLERCGLRSGMRVLDVGCGPGVITRKIAERVGSTGAVVGVDLSAERLAAAAELNRDNPRVRFVQGNVYALDVGPEPFDFVWSQYLFEYLAEPQRALEQLRRVTRPGGRIVVSDIDGMGTLAFPLDPSLAERFALLNRAVAATGFDLHVGRKLFHYFHQAGLADIRVHLVPQYVVAGAAPERLVRDWKIRFEALGAVGEAAFGGAGRYAAFVDDYLIHLQDPTALKYGVTLATEGTHR